MLALPTIYTLLWLHSTLHIPHCLLTRPTLLSLLFPTDFIFYFSAWTTIISSMLALSLFQSPFLNSCTHIAGTIALTSFHLVVKRSFAADIKSFWCRELPLLSLARQSATCFLPTIRTSQFSLIPSPIHVFDSSALIHCPSRHLCVSQSSPCAPMHLHTLEPHKCFNLSTSFKMRMFSRLGYSQPLQSKKNLPSPT